MLCNTCQLINSDMKGMYGFLIWVYQTFVWLKCEMFCKWQDASAKFVYCIFQKVLVVKFLHSQCLLKKLTNEICSNWQRFINKVPEMFLIHSQWILQSIKILFVLLHQVVPYIQISWLTPLQRHWGINERALKLKPRSFFSKVSVSKS